MATPKQRFQQAQGNIDGHNKLVRSLQFESSTDMALLEYADMLARLDLTTFNPAAAAGLKLAGAQEFLAVLKGLAAAPAKAQAPIKDNLDHAIT